MEHLDEIIAAVGDEARFIRVTFSDPAGAEPAWVKVAMRPVQVAQGRMLQAVYQGKRKQEAHNFTADEAPERLREIASLGFRRVSLQCADMDLHVRVTRKGKTLVSRGKPSATLQAPEPHDREKEHPLPAGEADEFLEKLGVMRHGKVLPSMYDKFRQINQFLMLLGHAELFRQPTSGPIRIVDCGCGRAFLTFAAYHYLKHRRGLDVRCVGVDAEPEVIAKATTLRDKLGYGEVELVRVKIADYQPPEPPHVVLSLHACDTATDDAIAQGVKWGAQLILSAPCCQHELHNQLDRPELRALLRHGILRERTADAVTDAFRAAALRVMGYSAEVIEFIDPAHTAKNLMIRAEKGRGPRKDEAMAEYRALREFWSVQPAIERLLDIQFKD